MREINTKVAGVTYRNRDETHRQKLIAKLKVGDMLFLNHDPENKHDRNAIEVYCERKGWFGSTSYDQIGFLNRELAEDMAAHMDTGGKAHAVITDITGGTPDKPTLGCNIRVILSH